MCYCCDYLSKHENWNDHVRLWKLIRLSWSIPMIALFHSIDKYSVIFLCIYRFSLSKYRSSYNCPWLPVIWTSHFFLLPYLKRYRRSYFMYLCQTRFRKSETFLLICRNEMRSIATSAQCALSSYYLSSTCMNISELRKRHSLSIRCRHAMICSLSR